MLSTTPELFDCLLNMARYGLGLQIVNNTDLPGQLRGWFNPILHTISIPITDEALNWEQKTHILVHELAHAWFQHSGYGSDLGYWQQEVEAETFCLALLQIISSKPTPLGNQILDQAIENLKIYSIAAGYLFSYETYLEDNQNYLNNHLKEFCKLLNKYSSNELEDIRAYLWKPGPLFQSPFSSIRESFKEKEALV